MYKNFLFADECFFWQSLILNHQFCNELEFLYNPQCIAYPDEFWPAMLMNEKD